MDFLLSNTTQREVFCEYLRCLPEGKSYDVSIKLHRAKRSSDSNRLYWAWIGIIANETGNEKEVCHKFFAKKFLGYDVREFGSDKIAVVKSTSNLDTSQFSDYMNQVSAFAAQELGIVLPSPDDQLYSMMTNE